MTGVLRSDRAADVFRKETFANLLRLYGGHDVNRLAQAERLVVAGGSTTQASIDTVAPPDLSTRRAHDAGAPSHEEDEMARRSRIVAVACTTVLVSFLGGRAEVAAQIQTAASGVAGEVRTLTALVGPSSDEVLLSVPPDSNFLVTQVCRSGAGSDFRLHNVAGGGTNSQVTLDNTECQAYTPGLVYVGGDDVVFRNNNATISVRVAVNGILTKK